MNLIQILGMVMGCESYTECGKACLSCLCNNIVNYWFGQQTRTCEIVKKKSRDDQIAPPSRWAPDVITINCFRSLSQEILVQTNTDEYTLLLKWGGVCNLLQIYWFLFLKIATGLDSCSKNMKDGLLCKPVTGQKELGFLESE